MSGKNITILNLHINKGIFFKKIYNFVNPKKKKSTLNKIILKKFSPKHNTIKYVNYWI